MAESWSTWQRVNLILAIYIINGHDAKFMEAGRPYNHMNGKALILIYL